jgi:hypothetical protein
MKQPKGKLESYLRGLGQDLSMNFADEATAGVESAFTDKTYQQALEESREAYRQAQQDNPKSYMAGEMTGTAASMITPAGIAKLGGKMAVKGAQRIALENLAKGAANTYGRNEGEDVSLGDLASVGLGAIPALKANKASKDIPWTTGKGVKIVDNAPEVTGKVTNKASKMDNANLSMKGEVKELPDALQEAANDIKGKVTNKDSLEELLRTKQLLRNSDN